jgi:hypothetical protein
MCDSPCGANAATVATRASESGMISEGAI